ncbi:ATP phosphoribosyltransferase regulatory subunit [Ornithinibacillus gellani]|uniref:ATP phosphoribosyltransferase regulatory subunit n=1 Tax=Ornithinibacillus gellani TaxID=2293253 RepID=UPI000F48514E|nr:ATP phosphoribosyltransferase regulatory subunit [Ornithinibacillus gellani]TQS76487.1 ATP phosphoribosyltransferase regulatory subunit [Ornithinibacillus gellani]
MKLPLADRFKPNQESDAPLREQLISMMNHRFSTYGYQPFHTPILEPYQLYMDVKGTIHPDEMVKVIDRTGKVLVLRPDVTIPISQYAAHQKNLKNKRYSYILDVFRQGESIPNSHVQGTQAGIECFHPDAPETDAEVLVLAMDILQDLQLDSFKIEIGDAGFFKELAELAALKPAVEEQLKQLIQAKNIAGIKSLLQPLNIEPEIRTAIQEIPLLYGTPEDVLERAQAIIATANMRERLKRLKAIFQLLQLYGASENIVIDLGLINHMNYYSGVIFQGYVEAVAKPVLMGGRYDQLAEQFQSHLPAIGFAYDVELLLEKVSPNIKPSDQLGILLQYDSNRQQEAISYVTALRKKGWKLMTYPANQQDAYEEIDAKFRIFLGTTDELWSNSNKITSFSTIDELLNRLEQSTSVTNES